MALQALPARGLQATAQGGAGCSDTTKLTRNCLENHCSGAGQWLAVQLQGFIKEVPCFGLDNGIENVLVNLQMVLSQEWIGEL